ncbi:MAG: VWA domain-containing protein [Pseudomonadales bacterium]
MEITLARFVHALRSADVPVSPAETLDGLAVVRQVGVEDPSLLRDALALTLAKTREEKARFAECFERFFHQLAFQQPPKRTLIRHVDREQVLQVLAEAASARLQEVVSAILHSDRSQLAWLVEQQAQRVDIGAMSSLRDKSRIVAALIQGLELPELDALLERSEIRDDAELASLLRYLRQYVQEQVRSYVDQQYALRVDASGKRAILDAALRSNLDQLPPGYYHEVDRVVRKLAERLASQHRRRRKRSQRGVLDLKRTLRENIAYDGALFQLHWRQKRQEPSTVYVICDLSNSVSRIARFLLLFLYNLSDVLPNLRTFAFSNRLGEISRLFAEQGMERAVEEAMFVWGKGTTDYGRALVDLRDLVHQELDNRSTLIFLGDGRGNYFDARVDVMRSLSQRVKQVFWLNPEDREAWGEGDSLMRSYAPFCLRVDTCRHLQDIERFADRLLTVTR